MLGKRLSLRQQQLQLWPASLLLWGLICALHISAVPGSVYTGVLANVVLWLLPCHQTCPLDSGTWSAWSRQVFGGGVAPRQAVPGRAAAGGCARQRARFTFSCNLTVVLSPWVIFCSAG